MVGKNSLDTDQRDKMSGLIWIQPFWPSDGNSCKNLKKNNIGKRQFSN